MDQIEFNYNKNMYISNRNFEISQKLYKTGVYTMFYCIIWI